jgi:non-specific serine/threonine protein kinase
MGNLPASPTSLVGREADIESACSMLARPDVRLLTVLGSGGVGKTRFAIEIGRRLEAGFPDGTYFVDLAPLEDPGRLTGAISAVLGVEGSPALLPDALKHYVAKRSVLLILDNFELIASVAGIVGELVAATEDSKFVVTSRVPLGLSWERRFPLQGLSLPSDKESMEQSPAVALFVERAWAVNPGFALSDGNAAAVAEVCRVLDGLPLAIELAAAQVDVRSPQAILDDLQTEGLDSLSTALRDQPERHQSLRSAIAWSERLLKPEERETFHALAVFSSGFTAEAAFYVTGDSIRQILDALVRTSLLHYEASDGDSGRYRMLEMVREYALEQLRAEERETASRVRHMEWCLALAEAAAPHLRRAQQKWWMDLLELEHANLRSALSWCYRTGRTEEGLRLVSAIGWFWLVRSHLFDSSTWCKAFLDASSGTKSRQRLRALISSAWLAMAAGENDLRIAYAQEALQLANLLGDDANASWALQLLMRSHYNGSPEKALELGFQSLERAQSAKDDDAIRLTYHALAVTAVSLERLDQARDFGLKAEAMHRAVGDPFFLLWTLGNLGLQDLKREDFAAAKARFTEQLTLAYNLPSLGSLERALFVLAVLAGKGGDYERAARLAGASDALKERIGHGLGIERTLVMMLEEIREAFGPERFDALRLQSRAMRLEEAVAYAREGRTDAAVQSGGGLSTLTSRECEIAMLVAQGLTDPQIAARLVISPRTAERHVANILGKLSVSTRTQIATWALEHLPASGT